jgi:hypothetical protein
VAAGAVNSGDNVFGVNVSLHHQSC